MNVWFPINKKLWTSSYVVFTTGPALVCLAVCYWIADVKQWRGRWTWPILVFGTNAIAAYFLSEAAAAVLYRVNIQTASGRVSLLEYISTGTLFFYRITCVTPDECPRVVGCSKELSLGVGDCHTLDISRRKLKL